MVPGGILPARRGAKGLGTVPKYPVITGPTSANVDENTTPVATFTADEPVTWSIFGGLDAAKFTISSGGALNFITAPDYEAPTDTNLDNVYEVTISAVNGEGNRTTHSILAYVMDVAVEVVSDPFFKNTTLLLHGDGGNNANNHTFVASGSAAGTLTRAGNTTQGSFSPYSSVWSASFDGSSYLSVPASSGGPLDLRSGDWTLEFWCYIQGAGTQGLVSQWGNTQWGLEWSNGTLNFAWAPNDIFSAMMSVSGVAAHQWHHIAVTRSGSTFRLFLNGALSQSATSSANAIDTITTYIGAMLVDGQIVRLLNGHISNVRVVKGTALYTAAFTPSTTPLTAITGTSLLTCADNRPRDRSINTLAVTRNGTVRFTTFSPQAPAIAYNPSNNGGSVYFDGVGDYLVGTTSISSSASASTFTIEGWVYPTTFATLIDIIGDTSPTPASDTKVIAAEVNTSGQVALYWYDGSVRRCTGSTSMVLNQWNYFAIVVTGNAIAIYVNRTTPDTLSGTTTLTARTQTHPLSLGAYFENTPFRGFFSDIRVSTVARAITAIPTAPLTADANTRFLLSGTNAAIVDSTAKATLETVGDARISTAIKKFGTGSIYFDGNTDRLTSLASDLYAFNTGDFTVECWFKSSVSSQNTHATIVGCYQSSTNGTWAFKFFADTNCISFASYSNNTWYDWNTSVNPVSDQAWHHLAVTRQSGTLRIFVDGVLANSWTGVTNNLTGAGHPLTVGWIAQDAGTYLTGYIDELRITKGVARYTANFTPPALPFPDQ